MSPWSCPGGRIEDVDPQGEQVLLLLRETAIDARALYPELISADAPWPSNPPLQPGGVYVAAFVGQVPAGCGALRPLGEATAEVRRMYVSREHRRRGIAKIVLAHLIERAQSLGYARLVLETGYKQSAAMRLYESFGFHKIARYGEYENDPTSVCYELYIERGPT